LSEELLSLLVVSVLVSLVLVSVVESVVSVLSPVPELAVMVRDGEVRLPQLMMSSPVRRSQMLVSLVVSF